MQCSLLCAGYIRIAGSRVESKRLKSNRCEIQCFAYDLKLTSSRLILPFVLDLRARAGLSLLSQNLERHPPNSRNLETSKKILSSRYVIDPRVELLPHCGRNDRELLRFDACAWYTKRSIYARPFKHLQIVQKIFLEWRRKYFLSSMNGNERSITSLARIFPFFFFFF